LKDVPVGRYFLYVKTSYDRWTGFGELLEVNPGAETDLGTIEVAAK
jgi:hypothetical protein